MLQNGKCHLIKFINQIYGRIDIQQIVIGNFFSMNLVEHRIQISIEITFLMRIFTITKLFLFFHRATESRTFTTIKIVKDSRIIMRRNSKRFFCEPTAFLTERLILCLTSDNHHIIKVLSSSTNQRNTTYINFFDDSLFFGPRSHSCLKRIQVNDDQIYFGYFIFFYLLHILFQTTTA